MYYLLSPFGNGPIAWVVVMILNVFQLCLLARLAISWLAPRSSHPVVKLLELITEPLLKQVRQVVPPVGHLDLSAVFVFIVIDVLKWLLYNNSWFF